MIDHTVAQIEETQRYFRIHRYPLVNASIAGRVFEYYQLPPDMPEANHPLHFPLPDFISRVTNSQTRRYVIGVSTSVPLELQQYFALAEYIEFIEIGIRTKGRVKQAEETIVSMLPGHLLHDYLSRKIVLFKNELDNDMKEKKSLPINQHQYLLDGEDREEFDVAIRFFEKLLWSIK